jgi:hypothetical protein
MKNYLKTVIIIVAGFLIAPGLSGQFVHKLEGPEVPWTKAPQVKGDDFRFVIISDLTGGEKEGVFAEVVEKINQLAPDFVMCVGDLIDGYTIDSQVMKNQWKSFHDRIAKLNAPFFYMPGNHDVANNMLFNEWIRLYGYDYYSFYISKSLFIIINAYEHNKGELSDKQVQYVKSVLEQHNPDDPVFLFSHPPLWNLFSKKGLNELEPLLNKYKTTFFCGDDHHYIMKEFKGHYHYMLSNSGGAFDRENISLGIFNHILWVTSSSGRLTIANILTDGIIPTDVVDNSTEKQVYSLLRDDWISIRPTYINESTSGQFKSGLSATNRGDFPLYLTGRFLKKEKISFEPDSFAFTIPAGEVRTIPVTMLNKGNYDVDALPEAEAEITAKYIQGKKTLENSFRKKWVIDNLKYCYTDIGEIRNIQCERPAFIEESWSWSGPEDGSFRFSCTSTGNSIHLKITVDDDILVVDSVHGDKPQDKLFIIFSADTSLLNKDYLIAEMSAGNRPVIRSNTDYADKRIKGECTIRNQKLTADLFIPVKDLKGDYFRLNIGFRDQDDRTSSDQSILWWRPKWGSKSDYYGSGMFKMIK